VLQTAILDRDGDGPTLAPILAPPLKKTILYQDVGFVIDSAAHSFVAVKPEGQPQANFILPDMGP
jgi:hypothetical protein